LISTPIFFLFINEIWITIFFVFLDKYTYFLSFPLHKKSILLSHSWWYSLSCCPQSCSHSPQLFLSILVIDVIVIIKMFVLYLYITHNPPPPIYLLVVPSLFLSFYSRFSTIIKLTNHTTTIRLLSLLIKHLTLPTQIITLLHQTIQLHPPL